MKCARLILSLLFLSLGAYLSLPAVPTPAVARSSTATSFCPALEPPTGPVVEVSTEAALRDLAYSAAPGTTILVQPGTYNLSNSVAIINDGITIRGKTGDRDDVILDGGGMLTGLTHVFYIDADDVTVADLTIRNAGEHGVSVQGRDRPLLYNLHIIDSGNQLVKINPVGDGSDDGVLACSRLEYTMTDPNGYTNGISAHNAHGWTVRDNLWERIRTLDNSPAPTILFWSGSSDTVVERNILIDCYQGIAFGNASDDERPSHSGGVVRNNVIYASQIHDVMVEMVYATDWLVAHNTVMGMNPTGGLTWGMEARFGDTRGTFAYNLTNMNLWHDRDGANATLTGNVATAQPSWFVDAANADLHLLPSATQAIDQATTVAQVPADVDGDARPNGAAPDVGADEYVEPAELVPWVYLPLILRAYTPSPTPPTEIPTETPPPTGDLIHPSDLNYRGAFRLPDSPGMPDNMGWGWSNWASAATYYPDGDPNGASDGYPGSIFGVGHDQTQYVSEVDIPVPVISPGKNLDDLNTAATLQAFQDITGGLFPSMELPRAGLAYLPAQGAQTSGKLYFAFAPHLNEGATDPSHGWSELDLAEPQSAGLWRVGHQWNYVTGDYLFEIPQNWANTYAEGRYLATGRYRDGGQAAQGPALFAIAPWEAGNPPASGTTLSTTPLLLYTAVTDAEQHTVAGYHHADEWTGGAWLTSGDKAAVVFVGTKGTGECWYGCADGTDAPPWPPDCDRGWWSTGFVGQFVFYDPAHLAAVTQGAMETWEPQPYAALDLDDVLYHIESDQQKYHVGALAFDRDRGLLYLFEPFGDGDKPLVHVWAVE